MKLWPFGKRETSRTQSATTAPNNPVITDFPGDLEDTQTLKYHGIRALCSMLMDRHDDCLSAHLFCGPNVHRQNGDIAHKVIAHIIPQGSGVSLEPDVVAMYLCNAVSAIPSDGENDLLEFVSNMLCAETTPSRKMTAQPVSDGSYYLRYGTVRYDS